MARYNVLPETALLFDPLDYSKDCPVVLRFWTLSQRYQELSLNNCLHNLDMPDRVDHVKLVTEFSTDCSRSTKDSDYVEAGKLQEQLEDEHLRMHCRRTHRTSNTHTPDKQAHIKFALAVCKFASLAREIKTQASLAKENVDRLNDQVAEIRKAKDEWRREVGDVFQARPEAEVKFREPVSEPVSKPVSVPAAPTHEGDPSGGACAVQRPQTEEEDSDDSDDDGWWLG